MTTTSLYKGKNIMQTEDLELDQTRGVYFPTALRLELKTSGNLENLIGSNYEEVFI